MISDDDDPHILSILDWQNACIRPLYLQFCEPTFLQLNFLHPDEAPSQLYKRPLIPEDISLAEESARLRKRYLQSLNNAFPLNDFLSICYSELQRMLIQDSGRSWTLRNGILTLRQGLINIWRDWNKYGLPGACPISFTPEEIALHVEEGAGRNGNLDFIANILDSIGMTQNGEVEAEEFEEKKRQYEEVKSRWIEEMNERVKASGRDDIIDWEIYWPFRYPQLGF